MFHSILPPLPYVYANSLSSFLAVNNGGHAFAVPHRPISASSISAMVRRVLLACGYPAGGAMCLRRDTADYVSNFSLLISLPLLWLTWNLVVDPSIDARDCVVSAYAQGRAVDGDHQLRRNTLPLTCSVLAPGGRASRGQQRIRLLGRERVGLHICIRRCRVDPATSAARC